MYPRNHDDGGVSLSSYLGSRPSQPEPKPHPLAQPQIKPTVKKMMATGDTRPHPLQSTKGIINQHVYVLSIMHDVYIVY